MPQVNVWAVLTAAIAAFVLGGLWYSPLLFGPRWQREVGLSAEQLAGANMPKIFGLAFVLSAVAAYVFALFLGPSPSVGLGLDAGFAAGLCWVATSFGINYLFARRSLALFLIDGGYHTLQFTLIGLILGFGTEARRCTWRRALRCPACDGPTPDNRPGHRELPAVTHRYAAGPLVTARVALLGSAIRVPTGPVAAHDPSLA